MITRLWSNAKLRVIACAFRVMAIQFCGCNIAAASDVIFCGKKIFLEIGYSGINPLNKSVIPERYFEVGSTNAFSTPTCQLTLSVVDASIIPPVSPPAGGIAPTVNCMANNSITGFLTILQNKVYEGKFRTSTMFMVEGSCPSGSSARIGVELVGVEVVEGKWGDAAVEAGPLIFSE